MLSIPQKFAEGVIQERGVAGVHWLEELPSMIAEYLTKWGLQIDGPARHGYIALVVPVRRNGQQLALKLGWVDEETQHEALALRIWNGEGAVKLEDEDQDRGVLLLERLNFDLSLAQIELDQALTIAANLLRRLAVEAPEQLPGADEAAKTFKEEALERWERTGQKIPFNLLQKVEDLSEATESSGQKLLVNSDLHFENVLAGQREPWLVIDPKVISGELEYGIFPLLLNRLRQVDSVLEIQRRFDLIVSCARLNPRRARMWTLQRTLQYWFWSIEQGLTEDPWRCKKLANALCSN